MALVMVATPVGLAAAFGHKVPSLDPTVGT